MIGWKRSLLLVVLIYFDLPVARANVQWREYCYLSYVVDTFVHVKGRIQIANRNGVQPKRFDAKSAASYLSWERIRKLLTNRYLLVR